MCYCPNVMAGKRFKGSLKRFAADHEWSQEMVRQGVESGELKIIPCGQCLECRLNYARNWAARCEVESYGYENNFFITLTYDDEHLPVVNKVTGEVYRGLKDVESYYKYQKHYEVCNLFKPDLQKFMKRLRIQAQRHNLVEDENLGIRYFACGEYGTQNHRPHYHLIVYGLKLDDMKYKYSKHGHQHFTSKWLSEVWGNGLVDIGGVDYESCQYVAQYVVKKQRGKGAAEWYKKNALLPEFVQMSLKPGIGMRYYEAHRDEIYSVDKMYLKKGRTQKPPRAYDLAEDAHCLAEEAGYSLKELEEKYGDAEGEQLLQVNSFKMREIKRVRREKAVESLMEQLKKTTVGILEYFDILKDKYEEKHKITLRRECQAT